MIEPENELFQKAYREAGRALALYLLCFNLAKGDDAKSPTETASALMKYCKGFAGVSIIGNRTNWRDVAEFWRATHLIFLGGYAAERIKWKIVATPSLSEMEFEKAYFATQWFWVDLDRNPSDEQVFAETLSLLNETIEKFESHWKAVDVLATTLIQKSELSAEETFQIITANIDVRRLAIERKERFSRSKSWAVESPTEYFPASKTILDHEPSFVVLKSLHEAKSYKDGVVILAGDDGSQTYLVCLASQIVCAEHNLELLLQDLDEIALHGNDPDMRHIRYMTGSTHEVTDREPFIHPMFVESGLGSVIHEVLQGKRERIR